MFVQRLYQNSDPEQQPIPIVQDLIAKIEKGELTSCLGGNCIEGNIVLYFHTNLSGVVLKHPNFTNEKGTVATKQKFVSTHFKERHEKGLEKIDRSMGTDDFLDLIGSQFNTEPRFVKGTFYLRCTCN